jgi:hypothetical protein
MLSSLFFYSLFRDMDLLNALILCGAIGVAFAVSQAPSKVVIAAKYPLICLCFALSAALILYPDLRGRMVIRLAAIFFTFFSLGLYVTTLEEKGKEFYKEVIALSLLLASAGINLVLTRNFELLLPPAISLLLFLFIMNRTRLLPLVGAYLVAVAVFLYLRKAGMQGNPLQLSMIERYLVLCTTFLFLVVSFIGFIRQGSFSWTLAFFGLLYASIDILLSVGFSMKGLLLYQPLSALMILAPLVGVLLQEGGS